MPGARRSRRLSWIRALLAAVLLTAFGSNSAVPGLLHGCGAQLDGQAAHAGMEGMHHDGHKGHEAPATPCACVDHSCCSAALVVPTAAQVPVVLSAPIAQATVEAATPLLRIAPEFLQPYPVGPPSLS